MSDDQNSFMFVAKALSDPARARIKQARLIEDFKQGCWVYCRLAQENVSPVVRSAVQFVQAALLKSQVCLADQERLKEVLALDPEALCRRQCCGIKSRRQPGEPFRKFPKGGLRIPGRDRKLRQPVSSAKLIADFSI